MIAHLKKNNELRKNNNKIIVWSFQAFRKIKKTNSNAKFAFVEKFKKLEKYDALHFPQKLAQNSFLISIRMSML